jgi:hypothetical protein
LSQRGGATLLDTLRSAWGGETIGQANRAADKRLIVPEQQYRLCLSVNVQPDAAGVLLDGAGVGTPQRFVWLSAADRDRPTTPPEAPESMSWVTPEYPEELDFVDNGSLPQMIPLCDTAVREIREAADAALREVEGMDGHLLLCQVKVATALGLLSGHWGVTEEDWTLSRHVMAHSNSVRGALVAHQQEKARRAVEAQGKVRVAHKLMEREAEESREVKRVAQKILNALKGSVEGVTRRELNQRLNGRDRPYVDDAFEMLGDRLDESHEHGRNGAEVVRYVLRM